ncbi:MAG: hypothetical protein KKD35_00325 [Elusimicrobia bacterium]|nr:hypothetical protein [Elusimicrobiota bacterium]
MIESIKRYLGKPYFLLLLISIFGIILSGYSYDSYYIPLILKNANPELFPVDLFVNSGSIYNSFYFKVIGFLSRYVELKIILFCLNLMVAYAMGMAIFYLSMVLFENKKVAYLSTILLLILKSAISVAFIGICMGSEASGFSMPFLLFSIILFLKKYYWQACLIVAAMFYIQGMQASFVAGLFLFHFLMEIKTLPKRKVLVGFFCLIVPILPMFLKVVSGGFFKVFSPMEIEQWLLILHVRSWYHLFPFSWGIGDWFNYSGWFIWAFIVFYFHKPRNLPEQHGVMVNFIKAIFLMCAISTVFSEIFIVPLIIKLVLWRSTIFFLLFLLIYMSNYLEMFSPKKIWQGFLIAATVSAVFLSFYKLVTCFALLFLAIELFENERKKTGYFIGALGLSCFFIFIAGTILPIGAESYIFKKIIGFSNLGGEALLVFSCFFICAFLSISYSSLRLRVSKSVLISLALIFLFMGTLLKVRKYRKIVLSDVSRDWKAVQIWANENTQINSTFVTPVYLEGFRIYSQRGIVLENKDGGPAVYDLEYAFKWWQRMNDFGYKSLKINLNMKNDLKRIYRSLKKEDMLKLARKYDAEYIVVENEHKLDLKKIYQNGHFKVLSIR